MATRLLLKAVKSVNVTVTLTLQLGFVTQQRASVIVRMKQKATSVNLASLVTMATHDKVVRVIDNVLHAEFFLPLLMEAWEVTRRRIVAISTVTQRMKWRSRIASGCSTLTALSGESRVDWESTDRKRRKPLFSCLSIKERPFYVQPITSTSTMVFPISCRWRMDGLGKTIYLGPIARRKPFSLSTFTLIPES